MIANLVASMRQIQNIKENRKDRYTSEQGGKVTNTWQKNAESCMAEMAVAKALGIYWDGNVGNRKADLTTATAQQLTGAKDSNAYGVQNIDVTPVPTVAKPAKPKIPDLGIKVDMSIPKIVPTKKR